MLFWLRCIEVIDLLKLLELDVCTPIDKFKVNIIFFGMLFSFIRRTNCVQWHKSLRILAGLVTPTSNIYKHWLPKYHPLDYTLLKTKSTNLTFNLVSTKWICEKKHVTVIYKSYCSDLNKSSSVINIKMWQWFLSAFRFAPVPCTFSCCNLY